MSRRDFVVAALPGGAILHLTRAESAAMVRDGAAEFSDSSYDRITVNQQGALQLRGLSCRVGELLTIAVRRKLSWAEVMLSDIERRPAPELAIA